MNTWKEKVLLRLAEQAESKSDIASACLELVDYYKTEKPLSALAFGLKARRIGGYDFEIGPLVGAVEKLRRTELNEDPVGCYRLGCELSSYPEGESDVRKAITYLKIAADADGCACAGPAALNLADFLSSIGENSTDAYRYYQRAEALGFCDILPPRRVAQRSAASA